MFGVCFGNIIGMTKTTIVAIYQNFHIGLERLFVWSQCVSGTFPIYSLYMYHIIVPILSIYGEYFCQIILCLVNFRVYVARSRPMQKLSSSISVVELV